MNVIDTIRGNSITSLQKKSQNAFVVFKKTLDNLTKVNVKINEVEAKKLDKQRLLAEEIEALGQQRALNNRLVEKITEFIS